MWPAVTLQYSVPWLARIRPIHGTVLLRRRRVPAAVVQAVVVAVVVVVDHLVLAVMTMHVQTHATTQILWLRKQVGWRIATTGVKAKVAHGQTTISATNRNPQLRRKRAAVKPFMAPEKHVLKPL